MSDPSRFVVDDLFQLVKRLAAKADLVNGTIPKSQIPLNGAVVSATEPTDITLLWLDLNTGILKYYSESTWTAAKYGYE